MRSTVRQILIASALTASAAPAFAQGELVLYCSVQEEWCRPMVAAFERPPASRC
jgi:iron(III) transport system substrate-binding protein